MSEVSFVALLDVMYLQVCEISLQGGGGFAAIVHTYKHPLRCRNGVLAVKHHVAVLDFVQFILLKAVLHGEVRECAGQGGAAGRK